MPIQLSRAWCQKAPLPVKGLTGRTKQQITVLACTSAAGYALPPYVVFDRKTLNLLKERCLERHTDCQLVDGWTENCSVIVFFLQYVPSSRPLLLLLDGHISHYCPEMIKAAAAEGVIIFTLPPHTTHLSQPLD